MLTINTKDNTQSIQLLQTLVSGCKDICRTYCRQRDMYTHLWTDVENDLPTQGITAELGPEEVALDLSTLMETHAMMHSNMTN